MLKCSKCRIPPQSISFPGVIARSYLKLRCPRCRTETKPIKSDYGIHGKGPDAAKVLETEWNQMQRAQA
jgi:hypothetical protein